MIFSKLGRGFISPSLFFIALFSLSCDMVRQTITTQHAYRKDLKVCVNDQCDLGGVVVNPSPTYKVEVKTLGQLDYFAFQTCHRHDPYEDQGDSMEYDYTPSAIEKDCSAELTGLDAKKGKHSFGSIYFVHPDYQLPIHIQCNGRSADFNGTGFCQSKMGLVQEIDFAMTVEVNEDPVSGCPVLAKKDTKFQFPIGKGDCIYLFKESGGARFARVYTFGYEDEILKQN